MYSAAFGDLNMQGLIPDSRTHQRYPWDKRWTGILSFEVPALRLIGEVM